MRILVVSVNVIWLLVWTYLWITGEPNIKGIQGYLVMLCIYIPPIVTLYYLYLSKSEGENLISLWLKVRKKKLKDELEDSD